MLGRPNTLLPVFMKICPGAWVNCVVRIERTMAMSAAIVARCGSDSDSSAPVGTRLAGLLEREGRAERRRRPLDEREPMPLLHEFRREFLAAVLPERGFVVEQIELRWRPRHEQVEAVLRVGPEVRRARRLRS